MRSSFSWRSTTARTTAVMASTPPSRSYRDLSTVLPPPPSCEDLGLARKGLLSASKPVIQHHRGPSRPNRQNGWFLTLRSGRSDSRHGGCTADVRSTRFDRDVVGVVMQV